MKHTIPLFTLVVLAAFTTTAAGGPPEPSASPSLIMVCPHGKCPAPKRAPPNVDPDNGCYPCTGTCTNTAGGGKSCTTPPDGSQSGDMWIAIDGRGECRHNIDADGLTVECDDGYAMWCDHDGECEDADDTTWSDVPALAAGLCEMTKWPGGCALDCGGGAVARCRTVAHGNGIDSLCTFGDTSSGVITETTIHHNVCG